MENIPSNNEVNQIPVSNYANYNTFVPNDTFNGNYCDPMVQYSYNNYYNNYYQTPQFNTNYAQYGYYPPNNYNYSLHDLNQNAGSEKHDSSVSVDTSHDCGASTSATSTSSSSLASLNGEFIPTISPIATMKESKEKSAPVPAPLDQSDDEPINESESRVKRRTRTQFNKYQLDTLEDIFHKNHYPDVQTVDNLAEKLGLTIERISVWFQNRRAKFKKSKKPSNYSADRLYPEDNRTISLSNRDPIAFQKVASLPPKPVYGTEISFQNQTWPNFNSNLIKDRFKN